MKILTGTFVLTIAVVLLDPIESKPSNTGAFDNLRHNNHEDGMFIRHNRVFKPIQEYKSGVVTISQLREYHPLNLTPMGVVTELITPTGTTTLGLNPITEFLRLIGHENYVPGMFVKDNRVFRLIGENKEGGRHIARFQEYDRQSLMKKQVFKLVLPSLPPHPGQTSQPGNPLF